MSRDPRAPLTILDQRQIFEDRLGHSLAAHPLALHAGSKMLRAAGRYLDVRCRAAGEGRAGRVSAPTESRLELLRRCASPILSHFAGRVGDDEESLELVFRGRGNLRESMAHLWLFVCKLLFEDLAGSGCLGDGLELAQAAGYDTDLLGSMMESALKRKADLSGQSNVRLEDLDAYEDFGKMLWHPLRREQESSRMVSSAGTKQASWSLQTRQEFELEGGAFNFREGYLSSPFGPDHVPWMDPRRMWLPNPSDPFVRASRKAQVPLATGLSGVTMQYLIFARILKVEPAEEILLATLGYLMSIKAHSYHEIMSTAALFGCSYDGRVSYQDLAFSGVDELGALAEMMPPPEPRPVGLDEGALPPLPIHGGTPSVAPSNPGRRANAELGQSTDMEIL